MADIQKARQILSELPPQEREYFVSNYNKLDSDDKRSTAVDRLVSNYEQQRQGSIQTAGSTQRLSDLRPPTIPERIAANIMYPMNKRAHEAYMLRRGAQPQEQHTNWAGPREALADIAEVGIPEGVRAAGQRIGELGGILGGSGGGPAGAAMGDLAGSAMGRAGGQALLEAGLKPTGLSEPGVPGRIMREGGVGVGSAAAGKVLQGFGGLVGDIAAKAGKKLEPYMLTNVTKMPPLMQKWVDGRWSEVYHKTAQPIRQLWGTVSRNVVDRLKGIQDDLGKEVTRLKMGMVHSVDKADFTGLARAFYEKLKGYADLTYAERTSLLRIAAKLERYGGTTTRRVGESATRGAFAATGNAATATQFGRRMARGAHMRFIDAWDDLLEVQRGVATGMKGVQGKTFAEATPVTAAAGTLDSMVRGLMRAHDPDFEAAATLYKNLTGGMDAIDQAVGKRPTQLVTFLAKKLFVEEDPSAMAGKDAFDNLVASGWVPERILNEIKDYTAAAFMKGADVLTAGVRTFLPRAAAATLGAGLGAAIGGRSGGTTGAILGGALGGAATVPYMIPSWISPMHASMERMGPRAAAIGSGLATGLTRLPVVLSPLTNALQDLEEKFGIAPTQEDLNKLKTASRAQAVGR